MNQISGLVKNKDLKAGVEQLVSSSKQLERKLAEFKQANTGSLKKEILHSIVEVKGVRLIAKLVEMDAEEMKNISFQLPTFSRNMVIQVFNRK